MNRRQPLMIAALWLATVAGASALTWGVISSAGTQVGQPVPVTSGLTTRSANPTAGAPTATPTRTPSVQPSQPTAPTGKASTTKPTVTTTSAAPTTIRGSWSGDAGEATATCTGSAVAFVSAVPRDGYKVKAEKEGTRRLEIEFEATGPNGEEKEVKLNVSCTDGKPVFRRD